MIQQPSFKPQSYKTYEIPNPGSGGLNIQDLEYNLTSNQSPAMLNRMMRNGSFGKRYGQEWISEVFPGEIYALGSYRDKVIVHAGTKICAYDKLTRAITELYDGLTESAGQFLNFNKNIYYLNGHEFVVYDNKEVKPVDPFIPDVVINRTPSGDYSDLIDNYNRLGKGWKNTFNGDGTSKEYKLTQDKLDTEPAVKVEIGGKEVTEGFTVDYEAGKVTFTEAPEKGQNNVVITAYKTEQEYIDSILKCKFMTAYGGSNNSRMFVAGNGNSICYYSDVFDASYFPENNYNSLGNGEQDIVGFGEQYDTLIVFKPSEMFTLKYVNTTDGKARFDSTLLNSKMGCDCPYSIQYLDNKLTWLSTVYGACTLVSTLIEGERNVQVISRNINGGFRSPGLLQEVDLPKARTVNFDGKYWVAINGKVYLWDYTTSPYKYSGNPDFDAQSLAWFLFDNFHVNDWVVDDKDLFHARGDRLVGLTPKFNDFGDPINSYYQTPFMQFGLFDYLKTVKKMFVMVRGDTPTRIKIRYITEDSRDGEEEVEDIQVYSHMWSKFAWSSFGWTVINFGKTFTRNCSLKKIQLLSVWFGNNEYNRDMSISALRFMYVPVKKIK